MAVPTKILSGAQTGADRTALNWGHPLRRPVWRLDPDLKLVVLDHPGLEANW